MVASVIQALSESWSNRRHEIAKRQEAVQKQLEEIVNRLVRLEQKFEDRSRYPRNDRRGR